MQDCPFELVHVVYFVISSVLYDNRKTKYADANICFFSSYLFYSTTYLHILLCFYFDLTFIDDIDDFIELNVDENVLVTKDRSLVCLYIH